MQTCYFFFILNFKSASHCFNIYTINMTDKFFNYFSSDTAFWAWFQHILNVFITCKKVTKSLLSSFVYFFQRLTIYHTPHRSYLTLEDVFWEEVERDSVYTFLHHDPLIKLIVGVNKQHKIQFNQKYLETIITVKITNSFAAWGNREREIERR